MRRTVFALLLLACPFQAGGQPTPKPPVSDTPAGFHTVKLGKHTFTLPKGFTIEVVAESPQVDRPVTAAFDDKGRLFVADSSGDNWKPAEQLKKPTHSVVMLESTKKDGKFDKSTVFADKLSFMQGTMWRDGSLYVATPPTIQKLTDTDGDGVADKREVWFDGGVLTGCANDVHGPYPGPDGRIYWTKGAFAKQELTLGNGKKFTTRAAHIYSAKADGSDIRVEMTGGMDNPVDVAFNSAGEMFFTTTFVQHPANGKRDGIIHATYGAVYGKDHDVLSDHPWAYPTLNEPMTHLGPAAPAGLHCYRSSAFGEDYGSNLFACQFNLAKVSRHVLKPKGSTYTTTDSDFVTSDNRDFHPTDVIEDADGSLLIVDTGGWYKLCCPSSVMEKKDVLGAVYRVRKTDGEKHPRGPDFAGRSTLPLTLDTRNPNLCRRSAEQYGRLADAKAVPKILEALADEKNDTVLDTALTRALIDIGDPVQIKAGLKKEGRPRLAAMIALSQLPGENVGAKQVAELYASGEAGRAAAVRMATGNDEIAGAVVRAAYEALIIQFGRNPEGMERIADYAETVRRLAHRPSVRKFLIDEVFTVPKEGGDNLFTRGPLLFVNYDFLFVQVVRLPDPPAEWFVTFAKYIELAAEDNERVIPLEASLVVPRPKTFPGEYLKAVRAALKSDNLKADVRIMGLAVVPDAMDDGLFKLAVEHLNQVEGSALRAKAAESLAKAGLSAKQLAAVAEAIPTASPLDLDKLLAMFAKSTDEAVGLALVKSLSKPKVRAAIRAEQVKPLLDKYPNTVQTETDKLYKLLESDRAEMTSKLETITKDTQPGDVRKGQAVFNSAKAACTACHKIAYVGGQIGPDLTKIGGIRSEKDLLEAIVFPSVSFVRSYEPVKVETKSGKSYNGILKSDAGEVVVLTVSATEEVRIDRKDIDEMKPGTVSIMPAGLDQQLTKQELADLVAFLRSLK